TPYTTNSPQVGAGMSGGDPSLSGGFSPQQGMPSPVSTSLSSASSVMPSMPLRGSDQYAQAPQNGGQEQEEAGRGSNRPGQRD
ncbi:MAG TPA: hypothetical protein VKQ36_02555, partial [Ktedonobacterales bacterium]|nr:hypothetical protein [Ktedonobacterales bacterium]